MAFTCGRAPPGQKSHCFAQDLIGLAQSIFAFQPFDLLLLLTAQGRPLTGIALMLTPPTAKGFGSAADLRCN